MNIALIEPIGIPEESVRALARPIEEAGHIFTYHDTKTTDPDELARRSAGQDIVMIANNPYPAAVVEASSDLKMIDVAFTGIDHVALDACRARDIAVCNCAGYSDVAVAELSVGLAIDVFRKVVAADAVTRQGGTSAGLMGREIAGKTVGIIGTGHIGIQTARLFAAFGARVLGYARHESEAARAAGIVHTPLDELLAESDIISLHLPLNDATRGFIGAAELARMKPSAILINCARGPIVDEDALANALEAGKIAGAGIDVFDGEPPLAKADHRLLSAPNAVLTPHVGFLTEEAMERRARIAFDNVTAWLAGAPQNVCAL